MQKNKKVVILGGGTGTSYIVRGLKYFPIDLTCVITVSGNSWVDFVSKGTGKGEALQQIGLKFGIKPEEMIAFGDNENDRTMLF